MDHSPVSQPSTSAEKLRHPALASDPWRTPGLGGEVQQAPGIGHRSRCVGPQRTSQSSSQGEFNSAAWGPNIMSIWSHVTWMSKYPCQNLGRTPRPIISRKISTQLSTVTFRQCYEFVLFATPSACCERAGKQDSTWQQLFSVLP